MKPNELKELLKTISDLDLKEVRIKDKDFELRVRTGKDDQVQGGGQPISVMHAPAPATMPMAPAAAPTTPAPAGSEGSAPASADNADEANYIEVKSPMVGTFYRSSSPDKPPFVQVGDNISTGSVVCIIEAMKLFNEIESEVSGKIVKVCIDDSTPVEYDQVLFLVDPKG